MITPMVDLVGQYQKIKPEIDEAILNVIQSSQFINGQAVKDFAFNLSKYLNAAHVIPCANGTDALQIALMALELEPGDEVITTPFTFVATAEVIALLRLKPVFVDIDIRTFNIDASQIEARITNRTKCIIPVHLFGQSAEMAAIMDIAKRHDLYVVEDNAQSVGTKCTLSDGSRKITGTIGDIGTLSFFPSKNLGAYGDAGGLMTNDDRLAEKMQMICNHGAKKKYYHTEIGVNSRMDTLQAVILDIKLKYLNEYTRIRKEAADIYDKYLNTIPGIVLPCRSASSDHVFHQYSVLVNGDRDAFQRMLKDAGVPSTVYYPVPLHVQPAYAHYGYTEGDYPNAEYVSKHILSLPMHSELDQSLIYRVCEAVGKCGAEMNKKQVVS